VYATCSFLTEENETIVEAFLAKHPQFKLVDVNKIFERLKIPIKNQGAYFRLSPLQHATDGFFGAVMERSK
jgi:16S rRNA (cytosine967-C5)-methyltransferase